MANNTYRADFIYQNLQIQQNVIGEAFRHDVKKLLALGSTCIYPRDCPQPIREEYLLTGELEYTNEPYALSKIVGLKLCESFNLQYGTNYIAVMPTNLYGPNDNFHLENSHVMPAMIRKVFLAHCLLSGDWEAVCADMNLRPVEGVDGSASRERVAGVLAKYGITAEAVTLWGHRETAARVPLVGGDGRRERPCDGAGRFRGPARHRAAGAQLPYQHRHRRGDFDRQPGPADRRHGGLPGRAALRCLQTRRDAPQAV